MNTNPRESRGARMVSSAAVETSRNHGWLGWARGAREPVSALPLRSGERARVRCFLLFAILTQLSALTPQLCVAATFTTTALISEANTAYDGQDIVIDGAVTVTIDGRHAFNSLLLTNGAVFTHSPCTASAMHKSDLPLLAPALRSKEAVESSRFQTSLQGVIIRPEPAIQMERESDVRCILLIRVHDDAIGIHHGPGGMNRPLLAAHQSAFASSASRSASASVSRLLAAMASSRSQSRKEFNRCGGTSSLGIVTRNPASVVSTVIMAGLYRVCAARQLSLVRLHRNLQSLAMP